MRRRHLLVDPSAIEGTRASLDGDDRHHLVRVLRLQPGAELTLADGCGKMFLARISRIERRHVELDLIEQLQLPAPPPPHLVVVEGLARGPRTDWTLQKCTELGADELLPAICERSVARPRDGAAKMPRWHEIVRQAARQSERLTLPRLHSPQSFAQALQTATASPGLHLIATPVGAQPLSSLDAALRAGPPRVSMAVGPEGGFTDGELRLALEHGFVPVGLGPQILRAETAVVTLLAIVAHLSGRSFAPPAIER